MMSTQENRVVEAVSEKRASERTTMVEGVPAGKEPTSSSRSPSATLNVTQATGIMAWVRSTSIGVGIMRDIRSRAPYYVSDWTDAWNYRVIPAVVLIFFAK